MKLRLISDNTNIQFIKIKKIPIISSLVFAFCSIFLLIYVGLNFGIDFRGGTLIEIALKEKSSTANLRNNFKKFQLGEISIQEIGSSSKDFLIKIERQDGDNNKQQLMIENIKKELDKIYSNSVDYRRVEFVGPTVSKDLIFDGLMAIVLAIVSMLIYIWFRFELPFAIGAVIALMHDIVLTVGMFSLTNLEFNLATVAALLLIIGYSMNDTVVVYDRIRENLKKYKKLEITSLLNKSLNETLSRTVNTTFTTIMALTALYFLGGSIIKDFSFAMIWGIIIGTYSSLLIATPMLIKLDIRGEKKIKEEDEIRN